MRKQVVRNVPSWRDGRIALQCVLGVWIPLLLLKVSAFVSVVELTWLLRVVGG